ncbi:eCIS core domain-containing protein [Burkholderia gladioli]|uniref:eCIS core domain-containing protein n=1 Tax=Burkholderia gladioli TaxID=28095 RepID=UPI003B980239
MGKLGASVVKPAVKAAEPGSPGRTAAPAAGDGGDAGLVPMAAYHYGGSALGWPAAVREKGAPGSPSATAHAVSPPPAVPPPPVSAPTPVAPATPPNRTGLPDDLKRGVEHLAGVDLDAVRVHYGSPQPARLGALAYAFGAEIHLAPGQGRHLPHETWHIAQQAQGRVAPTVQWKRDLPGSENAALEREADRMGEAALRAGRTTEANETNGASHAGGMGGMGGVARASAAGSSRRVGRWRASPSHGVVQRMPDEALKQLRNYSNIEAGLALALRNARWIHETFPLLRSNQETYKSIKSALVRQVREAANYAPLYHVFIRTWNDGLDAHDLAYVRSQSRNLPTYAPRPHEPFVAGAKATDEALAAWFSKPSWAKLSNPDSKLAKAIPTLLTEQDFPERVTTALKLYFAHTANFVPVDNLGRDFRSVEHGQYYRSSNDPVRRDNTALLKAAVRKNAKRDGTDLPEKFTAQITNRALHDALVERGYVKPQIQATQFVGSSQDPASSISVYQSVAGTHTGSLGLIQNVYRTVQIGTQLTPASAPSSRRSWREPSEATVDPLLQPLIPDAQLAPDTELNYHDLLLLDRGTLIAQTAKEVGKILSAGRRGWRAVPIQSPTHASLILELVDRAGGNPLAESVWRNTFIAAFNEAAGTLGLQTRATHRGSFGFLYPSVSSVGGPVRLWPGLTPPNVFKGLVVKALEILHENDSRFQKPDLTRSTRPRPAASTTQWRDVPLYREALKTAVRYAQDSLHGVVSIDGPRAFARWIMVRLQRNLKRAQFLLARPVARKSTDHEAAYVKAASVIENLMEYSYLLEAFNAHGPDSPDAVRNDPYPQYLRDSLSLDPTRHDTATFYLDSGMQAIVTANLLARTWAIDHKRIGADEPLESIDLYSYFEYSSVDKENLYIRPINRGAQGYLDSTALDKALDERDRQGTAPPAIIAADLNPVLTSIQASRNRVPYGEVFRRFANQTASGAGPSTGPAPLNDTTVPIVDVTNAPLSAAAKLDLAAGYENFIIVESLSKHQQLSADKFTMGRLSAIGTPEFMRAANALVKPIEEAAFHRLTATYRLRADRIFYGGRDSANTALLASQLKDAGQYDRFMVLMGRETMWNAIDKRPDGDAATLRERQRAMRIVLDEVLAVYVDEVLAPAKSKLDLDAALRALPDADRRDVTQRIERRFGATLKTKEADDPHVREFLRLSPDSWQSTGIANVGNTCYLAAALNLLALSPYRSLFAALPPPAVDPLAEPRAQIAVMLATIRSGQPVDSAAVGHLLITLDAAGLLGDGALALNAQRDPTELLGNLIDHFGTANAGGANYRLTQVYSKRISLGRDLQRRDGVAPAGFSPFTPAPGTGFGNFADVRTADWLIKLPITGVDNLRDALRSYQSRERITQISGVTPVNQGGAQRNVVFTSTGESQISLGNEAPRAITIQLVRWVQAQQRIRKDSRPIDMPRRFALNGRRYRIQTVVYHVGAQPYVGHYTTSTRDDAGYWSYRDDSRVSPDYDHVQRIQYGYVYTYVDEGPLTLADANLLDLANPGPWPPPGPLAPPPVAVQDAQQQQPLAPAPLPAVTTTTTRSDNDGRGRKRPFDSTLGRRPTSTRQPARKPAPSDTEQESERPFKRRPPDPDGKPGEDRS